MFGVDGALLQNTTKKIEETIWQKKKSFRSRSINLQQFVEIKTSRKPFR